MSRRALPLAVIAGVLAFLAYALWYQRQNPREIIATGAVVVESRRPGRMPQTLRTRDVSGISLGMYSAFTLGVALWMVYGVILREWPIVLANAVTLALASVILATKIVVDRRNRSRRRS